MNNKAVMFGLAVLAFLVAAVLVIMIFRMLFGGRLRMPGGRARQARLGLVDAFDLDRQRQLIIVRRDNVEHLIMIGGPNDLVIESEIVRAEAREARDMRREPGFGDGRIPAPPPAFDKGDPGLPSPDQLPPRPIEEPALPPAAATADNGAAPQPARTSFPLPPRRPSSPPPAPTPPPTAERRPAPRLPDSVSRADEVPVSAQPAAPAPLPPQPVQPPAPRPPSPPQQAVPPAKPPLSPAGPIASPPAGPTATPLPTRPPFLKPLPPRPPMRPLQRTTPQPPGTTPQPTPEAGAPPPNSPQAGSPPPPAPQANAPQANAPQANAPLGPPPAAPQPPRSPALNLPPKPKPRPAPPPPPAAPANPPPKPEESADALESLEEEMAKLLGRGS